MKRFTFIKFCIGAFTFAQLISIFGDRLHQFSVVGMIGKVEPGSSVELLKLALFTHIPALLFAPLFGSLIDRWNKAAVLILTDLFRGLIVLALPMLFLASGSLYAFYFPVAVLSMANMLFSPAKSAIIPEIVKASRLIQFNAVLWGVGIVGTISGFILGGWLFDYRSWQWSFYADGLSYLFSVILLFPMLFLPKASLKKTAAARTRYSSKLKQSKGWIKNLAFSIKDGILLIRENRIVRISLISQTSLFGLAGILYVICIGHIQDTFQVVSTPDKTMYLGISAAAGTAGLLAGSFIAGGYRGHLSSPHIISIATIIIGVSLVGIAKSDTLLPLSIWAAALGMAASPVIIFTEALLQKHIPENFRGRVFSAREVLTKTAFLTFAISATIVNTIVSKTLILVSIGLLLALIGMLLERKKLLLIEDANNRGVPECES